MRIEFWLDYLCPLSYLTHKNLVEVLKEMKIKNYELYYRSFQLEENCIEADIMEVLLQGLDAEESKKALNFLSDVYPDYSKLKYYNTEKVHQLAHLAKRNGLALEYNTKVLDAYFVEHKDLSDANLLYELATSIGLDANLVKDTLETCCFRNQIHSNKENAQLKGINRVPHLRVNIKHNYSDYLTKEQIKEILVNVASKKNNNTEICGEYCEY